jgi:hypothetical protein
MTRFIRALALYVLVSISVAGLALAQTQEVLEGGGTPSEAAQGGIASANHALQKTYFQTVNDAFINLSTTWVNAFSDMLVNCPDSGSCAIAVTVSSQFGQIDPMQVAQVRVFVNGVLAPPGDDCCGHQLGHAKTPGAEMIAVIASPYPEVSKTIIWARRSAYPLEVILRKGYENQGRKS